MGRSAASGVGGGSPIVGPDLSLHNGAVEVPHFLDVGSVVAVVARLQRLDILIVSTELVFGRADIHPRRPVLSDRLRIVDDPGLAAVVAGVVGMADVLPPAGYGIVDVPNE